MGYVYYGNYASYYEVARTEALRVLGFPYVELEAAGVMLPVREMHIRYLQAARYDDLLSLEVKVAQMPSAKIDFEYRCYNQDGVLLNTGSTTLVFVDQKTGKVMRCPTDIAKAFAAYFG
jgi:acyl-CoA thioester hydrolase